MNLIVRPWTCCSSANTLPRGPGIGDGPATVRSVVPSLSFRRIGNPGVYTHTLLPPIDSLSDSRFDHLTSRLFRLECQLLELHFGRESWCRFAGASTTARRNHQEDAAAGAGRE